MGAELDDLFGALNRQADAIPLAGPDRARQRGRQRTRQRALLSVAAAVLITVAGVAAGTHGSSRHSLPATPHVTATSTSPSDDRSIPAVGKPIGPADVSREGQAVLAGGGAYAMWADKGELRVAGG